MGEQHRAIGRFGLVLALVLVIAQSPALANEQCRKGCGRNQGVIKFAVGTQYKYNYHGKIDISVSSAEGQLISTEVKAIVLLTQLADCQQAIQLQNVQILGNGKNFGQIPDIEKPIIINNKDGLVEDSICTDAADTQNSLNIKRAIASAFLVSLQSGHETDVFGLCPVEVSSSQQGAEVLVQKTKNLNKCAYRENIKQDFLATTFNKDSEIKSSPILSADYVSTQKLKDGVLISATVNEQYLYIPFSVGKNGAKAQVLSKLELTGTGKAAAAPACSKPRTIIFDNPHPVTIAKGPKNVRDITEAVKEVGKTIDNTLSETTAKEFINLIKILRVSNSEDIFTAYGLVKSGAGFSDKEGAKKIFIDALVTAGNGDAIEVAVKLLQSKDLTESERRKVFIGLSLAKHASEESLTAVAQLLNQQIPREAYLGIGNLAGKYCRQHECKDVPAIKTLTNTLIKKLGDNKAANRNEESDMIYILKALGNFHHISDEIVTKIIQIAKDKNASNRLRVAALETFLSDPCQDKLRNVALNVLKDVQQDSEIRIKAYLAAVQCPNAKIGSEIKALLDVEPSYQVGGFIVSHIRNLRASANPDKQLQKQYLNFISLPQKFPVDFRKWSYNGEFSYSFDTLGIASASETNVIYSQDSWLPRSTSLNLTAEIFGHNVNFLEIETRQENLDRLIGRYFGPKGLLRNKDLQGLWKEGEAPLKNFYANIKQKLDKSLRARRDVSAAEIQKISKEVTIKENSLDKDFDLDLSVKAFGSELLFININDDVKKYTPEDIVDRIVTEFTKGLDNLKKFEDTLRSNLIFLDAEFDYPTSLGFPLRLALEGAANVQLKTKGSIDVRALINRNKDTIVELSLLPSANVEISGRLTLDALVVENGLKVASNLHTALGGDIKVSLTSNGDEIEVKYNMPVEKQTLISANHEIVAHTREQGLREVNKPLKFAQNKDFSICVDHLKDYIGLEFCGEYSGPNLSGKQVPILPFPLAGDGSVKVEILSEDLKEYFFRQVISQRKGGEIELSTVGKNGQKKAKVHLLAQLHPEKIIKAEFVSPKFSALAEAKVTINSNERSLLGRVKYANNEIYAKVGVSVSGTPSKAVYKPILEYKAPGGGLQQIKSIEGQIIAEENGLMTKYTFDNLKLILPQQNKFIQLKGDMGKEDKSLFANIDISDGTQFAALNGRVQAADDLIKINAELKNSFNPNANVKVQGEFKRGSKLESHITINHGADLSSKQNILTISNSFLNNVKSPQEFEIATKNQVTYPALNLDVKLDFEYKPKNLEAETRFRYLEIDVGSEIEAEIDEKEKGDYKLEVDVWGLDNKLELKSSRKISGHDCNIANSLIVNGKKFELKGKVKHIFKPQNIDFAADLTLVLPTHPAPFKITSVLKSDPNSLDASEKILEGSNVVVDFFLKANKNGNANGNIKVNLKNLLTINGQLKANKGQGNGDILIDVLTVKKQVKAETTFTVQAPKTYNVVLTLYPVFNQDKNKKIVLSTQNAVTQTSLDSKNAVELSGHKFVVNLKGTKTGQWNNGKLNGEVEVIYPNGQYTLVKYNRDMKLANGLLNGNVQLSAEQRKNKNTAGHKLTAHAVVKNTNLNENLYDLEYKLSADDSNGKNLNADVGMKRQKVGDNDKVEMRLKAYGSILKNTLETIVSGNCNKGIGDFQARTTYGPNEQYSLQGQYQLVEDKPKKFSWDIDVKAPNLILKALKSTASVSLKCPHTETDSHEYQGAFKIFAETANSPEPIIDMAYEGNLRATDKEGQLSSSLKYGKKHPIIVAAGYSKQEGQDTKQVNVNGAIQYEQNKNLKMDIALNKKAGHEYNLVVQLDTPVEGHKSNKLVVNGKRADRRFISNAELVSDGQKWVLDYVVSEGQTNEVNIKLRCPDNKLTELYINHNVISERQFEQAFKFVCEHKNFVFESNSKFVAEKADDFLLKGSLNSPALKLNKIDYEIKTKPNTNGRQVAVDVKSGGKNLLSGDANYQVKQEGGKTIVEGSGSFKVKEQTKSGNFKFIEQKLTQEKNQEQGVDVSFDASLGNKAIDAEFKLTNKQFRILNTYCEDKKECAHIEVDAKSSSNGIQQYNEELEITVDLRKLGFPHEFGLKSVTNRNGWIIDHTVDVHFQSKDKNKYQYSLYVHPKKAGWSLTTPKRIVFLEAVSEYPSTLSKDGGKVSLDIVFYLDKKNQPNKKIALNSWAQVSAPSRILEGEIKFSHPLLNRPLSASLKTTSQGQQGNRNVKVVGELDIFAQPAQKLVLTAEAVSQSDLSTRGSVKNTLSLVSSGLGININFVESSAVDKPAYSAEYLRKLDCQLGNLKIANEFSWKISKTQAILVLRLINVDILRATSKLNINKDQQIIDTELVSYDNSPVVSHLEIKNWNTLKFDIGRKNAPNKKLVFSSGLIPGQIADIRADVITPGGKINLCHASLKLDESNFLKPDYSVDSKKIQETLQNVRADVTQFVSGMQKIDKEWEGQSKKALQEITGNLKSALPNVAPLKEYYSSELNKLKEEVVADKTIKDISNALQGIFGALAKVTSEIFVKINEVIEEIAKATQASFSGVLQTIQKELIPKLQEISKQLLNSVGNLVNAAVDVFITVLYKINEILEEYRPEIKQIGAALSGIAHDVGRFGVKAYDNAKAALWQQWKDFYDKVKALPIFEELKSQYQEIVKNGLPQAQVIVNVFKEVLNSIYEILPANLQEVKVFLTAIDQYLEKKLKNQPVDDLAELDKILNSFLAVIKKIAHIISSDTRNININSPDYALNFDLLSKLPRLAAFKFSPFSHILKEETQGYVDFFLSLVTTPRNLFAPFPLVGLLGQGQHVFTFDGRHITFPGNCKYLLARDALNGYFTLAGTYSNGLLSSITLSNGKDQITIKKGGQVVLNNSPSDLPVRQPGIAAYRNYYVITLRTDSGVEVLLSPDLTVAVVKLSGFYHAQIRGLLGNGNNDPYDDYTLPNGKIVESGSEFGNSYKIGNCPAVNVQEHSHGPDAPSCAKLFSWDSSLRLGYRFVKPDNFKTACNHGVAAGVKDTEVTIAKLYVTACQDRNIPVSIPEELAKCTNGEVHDVGEKFSVKLPGKAADVIILVDTVKSNENIYKQLVQPLISEISKELHGKAINDVDFHLITYGGDNQWPSHVTVNGKLQFKSKPPNVKFSENPKHDEINYHDEKINKAVGVAEDIIRSVKLALGVDLQARTYQEAIDYPFRANAVRSIIAVTSEPCQTGKLILLQKLRTLLYRNSQIRLNLITPFENLIVKDAKKTKDVIGFNKANVFTLSQGKKKPEGSAELHKDLSYDDFCVDFTVKNGGNVFVTNTFLAAKGEAKTYINVAAHNIVDQLTNVESGLDCECKLTSPWGAQNVCWEIYSKERSNKKTVARG